MGLHAQARPPPPRGASAPAVPQMQVTEETLFEALQVRVPFQLAGGRTTV